MLTSKQAHYRQYLQSAAWNITRSRRLAVSGFRCEFRPEIGDWGNVKHGPLLGDRCTEIKNLDVHHRWYERFEGGRLVSILGKETNTDLEVLCRFHHLVRHACRAADCPTCGDTTRVDEEDAVNAVEDAIRERGGRIALVQLGDIRDVSHCSYCER
jgi:hypothetical protein